MRNIYSPIEVDEEFMLRDDEKHELFYAKINKLPEDAQDLLFDINTDNILRKIAEQFQLNQNQTIEMVRLVRDIIIKDAQRENIATDLAGRLPIGENIARDIANKIINDLFASALEEIKKIHAEKFPGKQPNQPYLETGFPSGNPVSATPPIPTKPEAPKINPNNVLNLRKTN